MQTYETEGQIFAGYPRTRTPIRMDFKLILLQVKF